MNTISTLQAAQGSEQVAAQELELKGLLARVMEAPLDPVVQRLGRIDERLDELEEICRESRDLANGVHAGMAQQKSATERSLRSLEKSIEVVRISLHDGLAGINGGIGQLCEAVGNVDGQLGQVYQLQQAQQGSAQQLKDELLQSNAQHGDRLDSLQQAFQRKFALLILACGFSVVANIVLLVAILR
jgi:hypothetical protein